MRRAHNAVKAAAHVKTTRAIRERPSDTLSLFVVAMLVTMNIVCSGSRHTRCQYTNPIRGGNLRKIRQKAAISEHSDSEMLEPA